MSGPLPVTFTTINAKKQEAEIDVNWTVANEINIRTYEVEKSSNGLDFEKAHITKATGADRSFTDYKWTDVNPVSGNNYYRVRSTGTDGKYNYSKTVVVNFEIAVSGIRVFPNPAPGDKIGVAFNNMAEGVYQTRLLNTLGQTIYKTKINHATQTSLENIFPGTKLAAGIYQLVVTNPDHTTTTIKVIVQ
ncbi:MAG: T9SS type A sorting domain-containing protein [Ferruginibacter sp.]